MGAGPHQLVHHERVDHRAAGRHRADGAGQLLHAGHPLLEQICPASGAVLEQRHGVAGVGVLAQHYDADLWPAVAQPRKYDQRHGVPDREDSVAQNY